MYSDFIEDRLAENSEHIALLKKGIKNFTPTWLESNFRQEIKQEAFKPVDDFLENIFQSYDDNEKLFIYKSTYSQAGFEESITNLEKFVPGMKVEIEKTTFDAVPYLEFTKNSETEYISENLDSYSSSGAKISFQMYGETFTYALPYTQNSTQWVGYTARIQTTPNTADVPGVVFEILQTDGTYTPYVSHVAQPNNKIALEQAGSQIVQGYLPDDEAQDEVSLRTNWYFVRDTAATETLGRSMWLLNYRGSISTNVSYRLLVTAGNSALNFEVISQSPDNKLKMTATDASVISPYITNLQNGRYICQLNPVVSWNYDGQFPKEKTCDDPPVYNITVSTTGEVFKDYELFQARFGYLVKELLYYYDVPTVKYNITYEINAINKEQHIIHVTPRIFKFIPISGSGVN